MGLDASQWRSLGLELAGLIGLVLGVGTFLLAETMTFVEVIVAVLVLYLLVDRFVPQNFRLTLALPGLILGGYTAWASGDWPIYLTLWVVSWGVFFLYHLIRHRAPRFFVQALPIPALREGVKFATSTSGHVEPRQGLALGWLGSVVAGLAVVFGAADRAQADSVQIGGGFYRKC